MEKNAEKQNTKRRSTFAVLFYINRTKMRKDGMCQLLCKVSIDAEWAQWKSHATLTLLATQDLPTFGYNMIDPLKSWCWGSILFYPFKISRFS